jgi:hypothetical protein
LIDAEGPAHADLFRVGDLQVARTTVKVLQTSAPSALSSGIVYQVVARDASYLIGFQTDLAHYDEALAFAQRSIGTVRAPPWPRTPPPASDQAAEQSGTRWARIFQGAVSLVLVLTLWGNRSWFARQPRE